MSGHELSVIRSDGSLWSMPDHPGWKPRQFVLGFSAHAFGKGAVLRLFKDADQDLRKAMEERDALAEMLEEAIGEGHAMFCAARKGPTNEGWVVEEDCDCWRKDAKALIAELAGGES